MTTPERRRAERTPLDALPYIHIEPDNGGIVLNVSGKGFCFQAAAPVERNEPLRFRFEHDHWIGDRGELVWTDEKRKLGGVRFVDVTLETRSEIQHWTTQHMAPLQERKGPRLGVPRKNAESITVRSAPAGVSPRPVGRRGISTGNSLTFRTPQPKATLRVNSSRSPRKAVMGLLVSALGFSIFLFLNLHRNELGEALIHAGERLRARPTIQSQTALHRQEMATPPVAVAPKPTAPPVREQPSQAIAQTSNTDQRGRTLSPPAAVAPKPTVPRAREQSSRAIKQRSNTDQRGRTAIAREMAFPVGGGAPSDRVRITTAPQHFSYPVAPNPALRGEVRLRIVIGADGHVLQADVLSGKPALADACVRTIRRWRYRPLELKGGAVEAEEDVKVVFFGDGIVSVSFKQ